MSAPKSSAVINGQAVTTLGIVIPAGVAAGDLIILRAITNSNTTVTHDGLGYATLQDGQNNPSTSGLIVYKVAAAGDAGSTVTFTFGASNRSSVVCVVIALADVASTNPIRPTPTFTDVSVDTTSPASPAIDAIGSSTIIIWQAMQGTAAAGAITWTAPNGTTSVVTTSTAAAAGKNNAQGVAYVDGVAGTLGPYTATASQGVSGRMCTLAVLHTDVAGPVLKYWDGTSEVSATLSYWDGTSEVAVSALEFV